MRNTLKNYFVGNHLNTEDVFEEAKAIMLYEFIFLFSIIFLMPLISEIQSGYTSAVILHAFSEAFILFSLVLIRKSKKLTPVINFFFLIWFLASMGSSMILSPMEINSLMIAWTVTTLAMGALLLRGIFRIVYCCFLGWLPVIYIFINILLKGSITWHGIAEKNVEETPMMVLVIPIALCIYAIWSHTKTIQKAKESIIEQKRIIQEKNRVVEEKQKEILDSIKYAKRIQTSLLPTEKYIEKRINQLSNKS